MDALETMIEHGADINLTDDYNRTCQDVLVQSFAYPHIVSYLCSNGSVSYANMDVSPIEQSVIPDSYLDDDDDDINDEKVTFLVEDTEIRLSKRVVSTISPVLAHLLSNETDTKNKVFVIKCKYDAFDKVREWIINGSIQSNDLDLLLRVWNTSEILKIQDLSRYLQREKIIPILSKGALCGGNKQKTVDFILSLYDQSTKITKGRYVQRFCTSLILQNIHLVRQHEKYKDLSVEEFGNFIEKLYNDIDKLEKPDESEPNKNKEEIKGVEVIDSPSKGVFQYIKSLVIGSPTKVEEWDVNRREVIEIPVSWVSMFLFTKKGTMKFFKKYLIYGDSRNTYAIDYENIDRYDIDLKNQSFSIKEKNNTIAHFKTPEIEKIKEILTSKLGEKCS